MSGRKFGNSFGPPLPSRFVGGLRACALQPALFDRLTGDGLLRFDGGSSAIFCWLRSCRTAPRHRLRLPLPVRGVRRVRRRRGGRRSLRHAGRRLAALCAAVGASFLLYVLYLRLSRQTGGAVVGRPEALGPFVCAGVRADPMPVLGRMLLATVAVVVAVALVPLALWLRMLRASASSPRIRTARTWRRRLTPSSTGCGSTCGAAARPSVT